MATLNNDLTFNGSLGNLSAYKMKGVEKIVMRTKGGPAKNVIKTAASCKPVRELNTEWGGCAKAGARIRLAFEPVRHLAGSHISGSLNALTKEIQKRDTGGTAGTRSILFSKYCHVLEGFNLNQDNIFNGIVKSPLTCTLSREEVNATLEIPELIPAFNLYNPQKYPLYRFIAVLGIVPDMIFQSTGYEPVNLKTRKATNSVTTDWIDAGSSFAGQTLSLSLKNAAMDASCSLMLTIGIEFGSLLTDSLVQPVKYAGSAKILAMG